MNENLELLMHIYKTSDMGVYSTKSLLDTLKTKENKIIHVLEMELKEYEKYLNISSRLLTKNDITPKGSGMIAKMGSDMGIMMETIKDNSDAAIASMLVEGLTMGILQMNNKIGKYRSVCDRKTLNLARDLMKFQQNEIEKLKTFI